MEKLSLLLRLGVAVELVKRNLEPVHGAGHTPRARALMLTAPHGRLPQSTHICNHGLTCTPRFNPLCHCHDCNHPSPQESLSWPISRMNSSRMWIHSVTPVHKPHSSQLQCPAYLPPRTFINITPRNLYCSIHLTCRPQDRNHLFITVGSSNTGVSWLVPAGGTGRSTAAARSHIRSLNPVTH